MAVSVRAEVNLSRDPGWQALVAPIARRWKDEISKGPPWVREKFLTSSEGIFYFGSKRCAELLRGIRRERSRVAKFACSAAWVDECETAGAQAFPPGGTSATGMVLSREATRIGEEGEPSRRWTPAVAVDVEDFLDGMDPHAAITYDWPASPSAHAFQQLQMRGGSVRYLSRR